MENVIVAFVLLAIAGGIIFYLLRRKKKCGGCATCPYSGSCKSTK